MNELYAAAGDFLKIPIAKFAAAIAPDQIVKKRIESLSIFSGQNLGPMGEQFTNAIKMTERAHKWCGDIFDLYQTVFPMLSNDKIWERAEMYLINMEKKAAQQSSSDMNYYSAQVRRAIVEAITAHPEDTKAQLDFIKQTLDGESTDLRFVNIQRHMLLAARNNVLTKVTLAQSLLTMGFLWRCFFYYAIATKIGGDLDRSAFNDKLNEAVGEIPSAMLALLPYSELLLSPLKIGLKLFGAFWSAEDKLIAYAQTIATTQQYIGTYSAALVQWSEDAGNISRETSQALKVLRE